MAINAYLHLEGDQQGHIKGSVIQKGREGLIEVSSWSWGAERDFVNGLPVGKRRISEFHLTKGRDKATAKLITAFANNELMDEWRLDLWDVATIGSVGGTGAEVKTTEIRLTGAKLASIRGAGLIVAQSNPPDHDELTFVFQKIEFTWLDGALVGEIEHDATA